MRLRRFLLTACLATLPAIGAAPALKAQGTIRIGMTAADIPIAHDVGPRAMSPRIRGHVQPQSWFVDLRLPHIP